MPTIITRGAGSAQGLGYAASSAEATFIEDVFSTYLYTGNGSTQTITNGIDLSTKGGLVWTKTRSAANSNTVWDTNRGIKNLLITNSTAANLNIPVTYPAYPDYGLQSFNANGFTLGKDWEGENTSGVTEVSWTFRKQPKFFDIVTYTGTGSNATISHNLGSTPGCIIVKRTDAAASWYVYHRGLSGIGNKYIILNSTAAEDTGFFWTPTDTTFNVSSTLGLTANGATYVAYLFAHNAGGFGLTGTDNVISCGSFTTDGSGNATVSLGYEPQFIIHKLSSTTGTWDIKDSMRGLPADSSSVSPNLRANVADAEATAGIGIGINATGFTRSVGSASSTYIYIAIRRGPMKVPTSGTSVFRPIYSAAAANTVLTTSFPIDLQIPAYTGGTIGRFVVDRLRGVVTTAVDAATSPWMKTNSTDAETTGFNITRAWDNTGYQIPQYLGGATTVYFNFRRAPGFFDEVCYTGTGVARTVAHNLAAVPELMIVKSRSTSARSWIVYAQALGATKGFYLEEPDAAVVSSGFWNNTAPTSSVFTVNTSVSVNGSGSTFVAYLFATVAGVSKVGSYTGTGTTQTINCGFTAGSRFVMIKRTDAAGDWYVWDSARGIVAGNDPYILLNSTAAEVTGTDYVDTASSGFEISSTAPAAINANGGSFIFLAIA